MINQAGNQEPKISSIYRNPIIGLFMKGTMYYLQLFTAEKMFVQRTQELHGIILMGIHGKFFKTNYHVR
jgi:hypothetical protein